MKIKLDIVEEAKVEYFLNAYNELHRAMDLVNSDIAKLQEEQKKIEAKIAAVRNQDKEFKKSLEDKYGEGEILPQELAYLKK